MKKNARMLAYEFAHEQSYEKKVGFSASTDKPALTPVPGVLTEVAPILLTRDLPEQAQRVEDTATAVSCLFAYSLGLMRREAFNPVNDHRGVPSPRCLYPTRAYLIASPDVSFREGAFCYDPIRHQLLPVQQQGAWDLLQDVLDETLADVEFSIVVNSQYGMIPENYGSFKYPLSMLEAGHFLDTAMQLGQALGYHVAVRYSFVDARLRDFLKLQAESEQAVYAVLLFGRRERIGNRKSLSPVGERLVAEDGEPDIIRQMERACEIDTADDFLPAYRASGQPQSDEEWIALPPSASPQAEPDLFNVLYQRNSGRGMTGISSWPVPLSFEKFVSIIHHAFDAYDNDLDDPLLAGVTRIKPYVAVSRVTGMPDGLYEVDTQTKKLRPVRKGPVMKPLQDAFSYPPATTNLEALNLIWLLVVDYRDVIEQYGARGYRVVQLELGKVAQRIGVLSSAQGLFARPCRSYHEAMLDPLLGLTGTSQVVGYEILSGFNRYQDMIFDLRV